MYPSSAAAGLGGSGKATSGIRREEPNRSQGQLPASPPPTHTSWVSSATLPSSCVTGCFYKPALWAGDPSRLSLHPPLGSPLSSFLHALPKKTTVFTPSKATPGVSSAFSQEWACSFHPARLPSPALTPMSTLLAFGETVLPSTSCCPTVSQPPMIFIAVHRGAHYRILHHDPVGICVTLVSFCGCLSVRLGF